VCKEVRDRGLAWKQGPIVRRGEELALWSVIDAGNYNYIVRWTFRDDGVILGEVGATGFNLPAKPTENHTHTVTWRIDMDFNHGSHNTAALINHVERPGALTAADDPTVVQRERGIQWDPSAFQTLEVSDRSLKNTRGDISSYMLVPVRYGSVRNQEPFTQYDMWVTRHNSSQMMPRDLPQYVSAQNSVVDQDIVLWYTSSIHHNFRAEDRGATQVMWTGFILMPHHLFDKSPLYP